MQTNFSITGNIEILHVAEAVAREKGIPNDTVMEALKEAFATVARKKYGQEERIDVEISPKTGAITLFRERDVVESDADVEDIHTQITVKDAKNIDADIQAGGVLREDLPPIDFGRVTSQIVKQVMAHFIREAEREKQYEDYKDREGEIVTGVVKQMERGNIIIDFGKSETMLLRDQSIPREVFRVGDRIRAYIVKVSRELKGPQIFLSRTHPDFLAGLIQQEVPEIYDQHGSVSVKGVARDPGSRAKVAVYSSDPSIDPVGACIGPRGSRITTVYNELQGEKIDIIEWSPDLATYAINALTAKTKELVVEVSKIIIDEDRHLIEAVVPDDHLSLAIGRRGQNVRLAAELVGWDINVMSESEDSTRRMEEFNTLTQTFTQALNVEEVIAQLLVTEGFKTLEEVAYVPIEELLTIEEFDEELIQELRNRAEEYLEEKRQRTEEAWKRLKVEATLLDLPGMNDDIMVAFGEKGIKTLDDLADLASDEFLETFPEIDITREEVDAMIMKAREHWFEAQEEQKEEGAA